MEKDLDLNSELRGVIVSFDLTQGAYWDEFGQYLFRTEPKSDFYYEGLGNHDVNCASGYDCGGAGGFAEDGGGVLNPNRASQIKDYVFDHTYSKDLQGFPTYGYGDRTMLDRWTPMTGGQKPHYPWDWHDVHFIQLNVFPGNSVDASSVNDESYVDPMNSLTFLTSDLSKNAPPTDNTIGKPVVIIMHYDLVGADWSAAQKVAFWDAIVDLNVSSLNVSHTWIVELGIDLTSPSATTIEIMARSCGPEDNLILALNDEAAPGPWPCPPAGGTYQPSNPLAAFDGEEGSGTWTLTVNDYGYGGGGSLDDWSLRLCTVP